MRHEMGYPVQAVKFNLCLTVQAIEVNFCRGQALFFLTFRLTVSCTYFGTGSGAMNLTLLCFFVDRSAKVRSGRVKVSHILGIIRIGTTKKA